MSTFRLRPALLGALAGLLCCLTLTLASCEAQATLTTQATPKAGDRLGDRCYNGSFWVTCQAQTAERAPSDYVTRTWHLAYLEGQGDGGRADLNGYSSVRVDVIDTSGVCIYIARVYAQVTVLQQSVISKKDLPEGKGCQ